MPVVKNFKSFPHGQGLASQAKLMGDFLFMKDQIFKEPGFYSSPFGPPNSCGVYAICVMHSNSDYHKFCVDRVVYIGSSNNILKRIMNPRHIYRRLVNLLSSYWTYTLFLECDDYLDLERRLIMKYKPRFNKQWAKE